MKIRRFNGSSWVQEYPEVNVDNIVASNSSDKGSGNYLRGDGKWDAPLYYVVGNTTGTAGTWTGTISGLTAYYDGLTIRYKQGIAGATNVYLNINNLGAAQVYRYGGARLTTHWPTGTISTLTYNSSDNRWYATPDYNSTDDYRIRWQNDVAIGAYIHGYQLLAEGTDGAFYPVTEGGSTGNTNTVSTADLRIGGTLLAYDSSTDIAAGGTSSGYEIYEGINSSTMEYWNNRDSGWATDMAPIYLVGIDNGDGSYNLDNTSYTSFLTQTIPTSDDGKIYIHIGWMNNTYDNWRLEVVNQPYIYKDGAFQLYSGYATYAENANKLDGLNSTQFLRSDQSDTMTAGNLTINSGDLLMNAVGANTAPSTDGMKLSGYGLIGNRGAIYITNASASGDISFHIGNVHGSGDNLMRLDGSTSRVGIGTASPGEKLDVAGSIQANSNFKFKGSGGYYLYNSSLGFRGAFMDDGGQTKIFGDGNGSTPVITLDSDNVGIGTTPTQKLEVNGNINGNELHLNDTNTIVKEGNNNSVKIQTDSGYLEIGPQNTGFSHFYTDIGRFYFNRGADFDGDIRAYSNNTTKIEESTGYIYELGNRVLTTASSVNADTLDSVNSTQFVRSDANDTMTGKLTASGGINGLTLANGGIAGTNFNITGVNQLEFNDPGDGIVFKQGSSGDITLAVIDDSFDSILNLSGTNAALQVNGTSVSLNGHTHGSYDNSGTLTGANVYSQVAVTDGIVTGLTSRALTAGDIGAATQSHSHPANAITSGEFNTARLGSGTATSGYVLQSDGDGTASWAAAGGGSEYEWEYVTKVTGSNTLTYSSMAPATYEYKYVVEVQTTGEDNSNPYIRINNDATSNEYSYQYESVTQTAETSESAVNAGDAATTLIYTGADLSSYSFGGTNGSTIHRAEFIYSLNPYSTSPGLYTATIRGWAHTHWTATSGTSYDGMVQSTFIGTKDNIYQTEQNRIDYTHSINNGATDYHEMRVYRRERK